MALPGESGNGESWKEKQMVEIKSKWKWFTDGKLERKKNKVNRTMQAVRPERWDELRLSTWRIKRENERGTEN